MICIVDYGMGNIRSVSRAFEAIGEDSVVTQDPEVILSSHAVVLPGVGAFGDAMANLKGLKLVDVLRESILEQKKPFLGICLGMQLLASVGYEHGKHDGLNVVDSQVVKLSNAETIRIPHVGWNEVNVRAGSQPFNGIDQNPNFYFVHSYCMTGVSEELITATCTYGSEFVVALHLNNVIAVQFHPEKSQKSGLQLLRNFVDFSNQFSKHLTQC